MALKNFFTGIAIAVVGTVAILAGVMMDAPSSMGHQGGDRAAVVVER
jgi:hypothetical protein